MGRKPTKVQSPQTEEEVHGKGEISIKEFGEILKENFDHLQKLIKTLDDGAKIIEQLRDQYTRLREQIKEKYAGSQDDTAKKILSKIITIFPELNFNEEIIKFRNLKSDVENLLHNYLRKAYDTWTVIWDVYEKEGRIKGDDLYALSGLLRAVGRPFARISMDIITSRNALPNFASILRTKAGNVAKDEDIPQEERDRIVSEFEKIASQLEDFVKILDELIQITSKLGDDFQLVADYAEKTGKTAPKVKKVEEEEEIYPILFWKEILAIPLPSFEESGPIWEQFKRIVEAFNQLISLTVKHELMHAILGHLSIAVPTVEERFESIVEQEWERPGGIRETYTEMMKEAARKANEQLGDEYYDVDSIEFPSWRDVPPELKREFWMRIANLIGDAIINSNWSKWTESGVSGEGGVTFTQYEEWFRKVIDEIRRRIPEYNPQTYSLLPTDIEVEAVKGSDKWREEYERLESAGLSHLQHLWDYYYNTMVNRIRNKIFPLLAPFMERLSNGGLYWNPNLTMGITDDFRIVIGAEFFLYHLDSTVRDRLVELRRQHPPTRTLEIVGKEKGENVDFIVGVLRKEDVFEAMGRSKGKKASRKQPTPPTSPSSEGEKEEKKSVFVTPATIGIEEEDVEKLGFRDLVFSPKYRERLDELVIDEAWKFFKPTLPGVPGRGRPPKGKKGLGRIKLKKPLPGQQGNEVEIWNDPKSTRDEMDTGTGRSLDDIQEESKNKTDPYAKSQPSKEDEEERRKTTREIINNAMDELRRLINKTGGQGIGQLPGWFHRIVEEWEKAQGLVDWDEFLKEIILPALRELEQLKQKPLVPAQQYPFARFPTGTLVPLTYREESVLPIYIVVDTSGSVDDMLLSRFLASVRELAQSPQFRSHIYLVPADVQIYGILDLGVGNEAVETLRRILEGRTKEKIVGGGGTAMDEVVRDLVAVIRGASGLSPDERGNYVREQLGEIQGKDPKQKTLLDEVVEKVGKERLVQADWSQLEPGLIVVLTDGYTDFPRPQEFIDWENESFIVRYIYTDQSAPVPSELKRRGWAIEALRRRGSSPQQLRKSVDRDLKEWFWTEFLVRLERKWLRR